MIEYDPRMDIANSNAEMVEKFVLPYTDNQLVIDAFSSVDRERFVPAGAREFAYHRAALTFVKGRSTISMPSTQALLMDHMELTGEGRVLEVGTASGYGAALLSECATEVVTVEHDPVLASEAEERLAREGFSDRIRVVNGDGALGYEEAAPYDRIVVTAGCRLLPQALTDQLAEDGIIVAPVNPHTASHQELIAGEKVAGHVYERVVHEWVTFVPLLSPEHGGWTEEEVALHEQREQEERLQLMEYSVRILDRVMPGFMIESVEL